ncbi:hypothetical protein FRB90_000580 [Tulasnella sp. 427]|nr:hypothetical protein FRB90_000580 [Tulasnella sp. 427]
MDRERLDRLSAYRIQVNAIKKTKKSGVNGGYAEVVQAILKRKRGANRGKRVAVKKLRFPENKDRAQRLSKEFVQEVELLAGLSHDNVVPLIGFCEDLRHERAWIILSWEPNGNLREFVASGDWDRFLSSRREIGIGFCEDLRHERAWIILSWEPNGNLREFVASGDWEIPERISLSTELSISQIRDTFAGLEYLHTRQPPIRHGDIKSRRSTSCLLNILVSRMHHAVITDFGSARFVDEADKTVLEITTRLHPARNLTAKPGEHQAPMTLVATKNQLTLSGPSWSLRWVAPEVLLEENYVPSLASDIWSIAWVCWEVRIYQQLELAQQVADVTSAAQVMTGKMPFEGIDNECTVTLRVVQGKVPGIKDDDQLGQVIALCNLMTECWKFEPAARPTAAQCSSNVPSLPPQRVTNLTNESSTRTLLNEMGRNPSHSGQYLRGNSLRKTWDFGSRAGLDDRDVVWAFHLLEGRRHFDSLYFKSAMAEVSLTKAHQIYAGVRQDIGTAARLCCLGQEHEDQSRLAEAERCSDRANKIYARIASDLDEANKLTGLGVINWTLFEDKGAKASFEVAQPADAQLRDSLKRARALRGLGGIYLAQCKYVKAEETFSEVLRIYAQIGHSQGQANALRSLGEVYECQSNYAAAETSFAQAEGIYALIDDGQRQGSMLVMLGDILYRQSKYAEAANFFDRAQQVFGQIGDDMQAETLCALGNIYRMQSEYTKAETALAEAGRLFDRCSLGQVLVSISMAHLHWVQGRRTEAVSIYTKASESRFCGEWHS